MRATVIVLAMGLSCCSKQVMEGSSEPVSAGSGPEPTTEATAAETATAAPPPPTPGPLQPSQATELDAVTLPDMLSCVSQCVEQNQMRAVAPEQIEANCQKTCTDECHQSCEAASEGRPTSFAEDCRQDCARQIERAKR